MEAKRQDLTNSIGLLILRLGFGGFLALHGWDKLQMIIDGQFEGFPDPLGVGSTASLVLATAAEFGCALLVVLGLLTRIAAAPIVFAMAVAAFGIHTDDPWMMAEGPPSKEPAILYLIPFLTLIFTGAGRLSVDGLIKPRWRERRARRKAAKK